MCSLAHGNSMCVCVFAALKIKHIWEDVKMGKTKFLVLRHENYVCDTNGKQNEMEWSALVRKNL